MPEQASKTVGAIYKQLGAIGTRLLSTDCPKIGDKAHFLCPLAHHFAGEVGAVAANTSPCKVCRRPCSDGEIMTAFLPFMLFERRFSSTRDVLESSLYRNEHCVNYTACGRCVPRALETKA